MVAQLGRRKPILKKALGEADGDDVPDSESGARLAEAADASDIRAFGE